MPRTRNPAEHADFYASPAIYDILHTPGTAGEVAALERLARRFLSPQRAPSVSDGSAPNNQRVHPRSTALTILEPACGTGRYLRVLASHGHAAIGFDRDPGMVDYAAARLARHRKAMVFQADMESFAHAGAPHGLAPSSLDLAFTPINSIRHLDSDGAVLAHFGQVARVLKPTGIYAVGISITAYGVEQPSEDIWRGTRGPCRVRQVVQYLPAPGSRGPRARPDDRLETVISHMTVRTPRHTRHIDSTYTLRAYDLPQWERLIARSPLEIAAVVDESGRDLTPAPPGYAVFILRPR